MPKYGIHHIVLKEALTEMSALPDSDQNNLAAGIQAELPSAVTGSIGPDLFFWGPDYEIVQKFDVLYRNIQTVLSEYNKVVQPIRDIKDAVGEPIEDAVSTLAPGTISLIKKALEEIRETSSLFKSAIGTGLLAGVINGVDIIADAAGFPPLSQQFFDMFVPGLHKNEPISQWYWFDMLHYRRTGDFAKNLVENSQTPKQKAFTAGYLSHIATDLAGHPFVNQIAGTTYRLNVQRHVLIENYQDTWKYNNYYGESINETLFYRLGLPSTLPTDIGDLLHNAFYKTYEDYEHPIRLAGDGFYTREQIDTTYNVFYNVLNLLEGMKVSRPEEPFSGVGSILSDILDNFTPPPSAPPVSSMCGFDDIFSFGLTESSRKCYNNFFKEAEKWVNYLGELLEWTWESLKNLADLLLAVFLSLPITVLLAILYGIQLLCYQMYRTARLTLSTNGFVFPEPDELQNSIGRNLTTTYQGCTTNFKSFPSINTPRNGSLACPVHQGEEPRTAAAFHPHSNTCTPDSFINQEAFNEQAYNYYAAAETPENTRSIYPDMGHIGNARDLTGWMIKNAMLDDGQASVYANWNLDADRGYGYKAWEGEVISGPSYKVGDVKYIES